MELWTTGEEARADSANAMMMAVPHDQRRAVDNIPPPPYPRNVFRTEHCPILLLNVNPAQSVAGRAVFAKRMVIDGSFLSRMVELLPQ